MTIDLDTLLSEAQNQIQAAMDLRALDEVRVAYLGKSGKITDSF